MSSCSAPQPAGTDILQSEVHIEAGSYEGKGTLLAGAGRTEYVVSAAHLLEDSEEDAVRVIYGDSAIDCTLVHTDPALDLVIWKVTGKGTGRAAAVSVSEESGPDTGGQEREEILCAGMGEGSIRTGYVAGRDVTVNGGENSYLYLMLETEPGMSGSGIYSKTGIYMGTLTVSLDSGGCLAVPAEKVLDIIGTLEE